MNNSSKCIARNCFNCIYCQKGIKNICLHCSKCKKALNPIVAFSNKSIYIIFKNFIQFKKINLKKRISYTLIEQDELSNYVHEKLENSNIKNFVFFEEKKEYEISIQHKIIDQKNIELKIGNLFTILTNKDFMKIKNQENSLCNKNLLISFKLFSDDVDFIINGNMLKPIRFKINLYNQCSTIQINNKALFKKNLKLTTLFLIQSYFLNFMLTVILSFLNFKDLLDLPLIMKKKFSNHVIKFFELFSTFDCNDGFQIFDEFESLKFTKKLNKWLLNINFSNEIKNKEHMLELRNQYNLDFPQNVKSCKNCLNRILLIEIISISSVIVYIFLFLIFKLFFIFKNKISKKSKNYMKKILNFFFTLSIIFCLTLFFDQLYQILNIITYLNSETFSIGHFCFILLRSFIMFYGFIFSKEIWKRKTDINIWTIYVKNSLYFLLIITFRKLIVFYMSIIFAIQLTFFLKIYFFKSTKNRKNWGILFQEFYFLIFLVIIPNFIFEEEENETMNDSLFLIFYLIGLFLSIWIIFFDIFDSRLVRLRKIKKRIYSLIKIVRKKRSQFKDFIRARMKIKRKSLKKLKKNKLKRKIKSEENMIKKKRNLRKSHFSLYRKDK